VHAARFGRIESLVEEAAIDVEVRGTLQLSAMVGGIDEAFEKAKTLQ
jgi:hypothetical protein